MSSSETLYGSMDVSFNRKLNTMKMWSLLKRKKINKINALVSLHFEKYAFYPSFHIPESVNSNSRKICKFTCLANETVKSQQ